MSLTERIQSRNGEMHRQQIEILKQYIQKLERENRYYRSRFQEEREQMEQVRTHLAEDWYFVKRELYNFIQLTRAMTAVQARESPLLKNIVQFDQRVGLLLSSSEPFGVRDLSSDKVTSLGQKQASESVVSSLPTDVEEDTLRKILGLW